MLQDGRFWPVVGAFFLAGVLLSLTPCVLPMLPIVSSIIAGHGIEVRAVAASRLCRAAFARHGIVYTGLGVAAGLAGEGLAAALQTPWVLGGFAVALVALALSMFGIYELRLPAAFGAQLTSASNHAAGRLAGVCAMGGVSALIVSPCVAAPLAGALALPQPDARRLARGYRSVLAGGGHETSCVNPLRVLSSIERRDVACGS